MGGSLIPRSYPLDPPRYRPSGSTTGRERRAQRWVGPNPEPRAPGPAPPNQLMRENTSSCDKTPSRCAGLPGLVTRCDEHRVIAEAGMTWQAAVLTVHDQIAASRPQGPAPRDDKLIRGGVRLSLPWVPSLGRVAAPGATSPRRLNPSRTVVRCRCRRHEGGRTKQRPQTTPAGPRTASSESHGSADLRSVPRDDTQS